MVEDMDFMNSIIAQICDYAKEHNMSPNETIETIANNLLYMITICTFDNWKNTEV